LKNWSWEGGVRPY